MEIDVVGESQEIDPDDDMAGLMRELNDTTHSQSKPAFNESITSETSTDTAFSLTPHLSDLIKEDLTSV